MGELDDFRDEIANRHPNLDWLVLELLQHCYRRQAVSIGSLIFNQPGATSTDLPEGEPVAAVLAVVGPDTKRFIDAYHAMSQGADHIGILMGPNGKVIRTWRGNQGGENNKSEGGTSPQ